MMRNGFGQAPTWTYISLVLMLACSSKSGATDAAAQCRASTQPVTCAQAISAAESVAHDENVEVHGPIAVVRPYPVAQGESHPSWWVTFSNMTYHGPDGSSCPPQSFYVMVDATNGRVLAHDVPEC